jgi:transposase
VNLNHLSKAQRIQLLKDFIKSHPNEKEMKRALAVKLAEAGYKYRQISKILEVSGGFISKWKQAFESDGLAGLKSSYQGGKGYLTESERQAVIEWLIEQKTWDISELEVYLIERYDVVFQSRQSYYQLLKEARITWQKGEQINPRQDPEAIAKKNQEIADLLEKHRLQIEAGELVVYIIDECHLLWNDLVGYLWNFRKSPQKIPILNPKERQTYYGALELFTQEFILTPEPTANGELTVEFVKKLRAKHPTSRILLIWDGASYHRGQEMRDFLGEQNEGVLPENWKITWIRFAPYAPQENPVEAIWLQLKTLLRRFYRFGKNFKIVKRLFQLFVNLKLFNLPNFSNYDAFSRFA